MSFYLQNPEKLIGNICQCEWREEFTYFFTGRPVSDDQKRQPYNDLKGQKRFLARSTN
jgi:hypothetical protein